MQYSSFLVIASALAGIALSSPVADGTSIKTSATSTTATASSTPSASSYISFTPYQFVGCRQSQNPHATDTPTSYNLTKANTGCYTPSYSFASFVDLVEGGPAPAGCSIKLWSQAKCAGASTTVDLSMQGCQTGGYGPTNGTSFSWRCGGA